MIPTEPDSSERIEALKRYDILDTPPEKEFDEVTRLTAHVCDAPIALISFIDRGRQWFKSEVGLGLHQTSLDTSFSANAILQPGVLMVSDPMLDSRFAGNPLVVGWPHIRFYAGALIESSDGFPLGTLCVLDYKARGLSSEHQSALQTLARYVSTLLEVRRTSRLLEQSRQATERAERAKDQLLATLCHELRASLSPILMSSSLLLLDKGLSQTQRTQVEMIRAHVELETRLVDDLLELLQITQGELRLSRDPVDIHDLIEQAERATRSDATSIRIENVFRASSTIVLGDAPRLARIFRTLLLKALGSTPTNGSLAIITNNPDVDLIRIRIVEMGSGIQTHAMPSLFARTDPGSSDSMLPVSGLGLALSVAKGIVSLHDGSIKASSIGKNKGAMFTIELPTVSETPAGSAPKVEIMPPGIESIRILLVEGDENAAQTLARLLRRAGHDVETAETAARARTLFGTRVFDLVISNLGLPDGSGYDLMRELKGQRSIDGIALMDNGSLHDSEAIWAAGFRGYLSKPVDWADLEATVRQTAMRLQPA